MKHVEVVLHKLTDAEVERLCCRHDFIKQEAAAEDTVQGEAWFWPGWGPEMVQSPCEVAFKAMTLVCICISKSTLMFIYFCFSL
jgi:hypothetical protein